mmetsp:Transcript_72069/g.206882  ORF Transcript_72069/g.206882 Transcript_72069/m.206882 type:complete len:207 (+) Transcript_72069:979-1599(+)
MAAAPRSVNGSLCNTRCNSWQASRSCSTRASMAREAVSRRSNAVFASIGSQFRTLSGCTRSANFLYKLRTSAAFAGPGAGNPKTAKASGALKMRATSSSGTPPASALLAGAAASHEHLARVSKPWRFRKAPESAACPRFAGSVLAASASATSASSASGSPSVTGCNRRMGSASSNSSVAVAFPAQATTKFSPMSTPKAASQPPNPC